MKSRSEYQHFIWDRQEEAQRLSPGQTLRASAPSSETPMAGQAGREMKIQSARHYSTLKSYSLQLHDLIMQSRRVHREGQVWFAAPRKTNKIGKLPLMFDFVLQKSAPPRLCVLERSGRTKPPGQPLADLFDSPTSDIA